MEDRQNVQVLFLGTIKHQNEVQSQNGEKSSFQDEIKFNEPVQIELIRIPYQKKQLYSKLISQTQKQQIKSLEIYYRNLDKKSARYSLLACSNSELLMSSSVDILVTLKETIYTDLLVIRGNFTCISLCIYGRVLRLKQQIEKKCPYFMNNADVPMKEQLTSIKIDRNIFNESRSIVKAIEDQYAEQANDEVETYDCDGRLNDRELYDQQITNICKLSQQLLVFQDLSHIDQRSIAQIRRNLQTMQSYLSKLFKSSHIGLYYPTPYRASSIPGAIPVSIVRTAIKLLTQNLSDQSRSLQVLKFILQLKPHAQEFVKLGGVEALISLFLKFFSSDLVILSSLKLLAIQVLIVLSFWEFSAHKFVDKTPVSFEDHQKKSSICIRESQQKQNAESPQKSRSKSKSRSRDKKKKKSQISPSKSQSKDRKKSKKDKKDKKNKDKEKSRQRQREKQKNKSKKSISRQKSRGKDKLKQKKASQKEKQKSKKQQKPEPQNKPDSSELNIKNQIAQCYSFYEIILKMMRIQKNLKLEHLMRILIQQITQTITRNNILSNQMALYTPLLRDTKYMFSQGGQMINSKTLKTFASFQPFLNEQQSQNVQSTLVCQSEKIKHPKRYGISRKLFKLIDSALTILQSKGQTEGSVVFDEQFITLISSLIENNKNGVTIGLNNFIDIIKVQTLLGLKKQQAVIAIICQYIHQILIEDEGMNLIYFLDQIHNSMLKIISWLKQDKTFSLQIKRKVQFLINSALIYNHFSGTQNNFKNFSEYFTKLIGHENFEINKIVQYSRKQYVRSVNPLTFSNLLDSFNLGDFYYVMPAQPLLQIDICLKMFLVILKLNKNIWTVFYQYKFVPAFATLYLKIHALLKFFLSPSLQRYNALVDLKNYERMVCSYLQVLKHLTNIFIYKWKYESAFNFNQPIEELDVFDTVQLYEKWTDTYLFLFNAIKTKDSLIYQQRTSIKIREVLKNIVQLFDIVFKGYQLTKNTDRQTNIKSLIKFIYRQHFESISSRPGILSLLNIFLGVAGTNTFEVIANQLLSQNVKNYKQSADILLPENSKSLLENIIRKNVYRSDSTIIQNLSAILQQILNKQNYKQKVHVYELIQNLLDQLQSHRKQQNDQSYQKQFICEKTSLLLTFLSCIKAPMNSRVENSIIRILKNYQNETQSNQSKSLQIIKLRNSCLYFFKSAVRYNNQFSASMLLQYLKAVSNILKIQDSQSKKHMVGELTGVLIVLQTLCIASSNVIYQSVILYGQYLEKPYRPACEISLQKIFCYLRQIKAKSMDDQSQSKLINQIASTSVYLLCKLTSIDQCQFYSTQCRKNALNMLISPQKDFTLQQLINFMEELVPKQFTATLKNYIDFPLVQKPQVYNKIQNSNEKKIMGNIYSKTVFTMISQNDPVGKTRFQLIQDKWEGGDTEGQIFQVNPETDYNKIVEEKIYNKNIDLQFMHLQKGSSVNYQGIHQAGVINSLFTFKIRKISPMQLKKNISNLNFNILMKNVPDQIKKVQPIKNDSYQSKMNTSPQLNRNININMQNQNTNMISNSPGVRIGQNIPAHLPLITRTSNSNNRQPSPYSKTNVNVVGQPNRQQGYVNPPPTYNPQYNQPQTQSVMPIGVQNNSNIPQNIPRQNVQQQSYPPNINRQYNQPVYHQPTHMMPHQDTRNMYYPAGQYGQRPAPNYQPGYPAAGYPNPQSHPPMYPNPQQTYRPPPVMPQRPPYGTVRSVEEEYANQAINILMYLKQNPNAPEKDQLKSKVNHLFLTPGVHQKVTRYFQGFQAS